MKSRFILSEKELWQMVDKVVEDVAASKATELTNKSKNWDKRWMSLISLLCNRGRNFGIELDYKILTFNDKCCYRYRITNILVAISGRSKDEILGARFRLDEWKKLLLLWRQKQHADSIKDKSEIPDDDDNNNNNNKIAIRHTQSHNDKEEEPDDLVPHVNRATCRLTVNASSQGDLPSNSPVARLHPARAVSLPKGPSDAACRSAIGGSRRGLKRPPSTIEMPQHRHSPPNQTEDDQSSPHHVVSKMQRILSRQKQYSLAVARNMEAAENALLLRQSRYITEQAQLQAQMATLQAKHASKQVHFQTLQAREAQKDAAAKTKTAQQLATLQAKLDPAAYGNFCFT